MKKTAKPVIALILCFCALLTSCSQSVTPPEPEKTDKSGKYTLSDSGEAIITGNGLSSTVKTSDNNRVFYEIFVGSFSASRI